MVGRSIRHSLYPPMWLWIILLASTILSGLYHFGSGFEFFSPFLGLFAISALIATHLNSSGAKPITKSGNARTLLICSAIPIGMAITLHINRSPEIYWEFDTDDYTWRPAGTSTAHAWGEDMNALQLHPQIGSDNLEGKFGPWRAISRIDKVFPGKKKLIVLHLTQPEYTLASGNAKPPPTSSENDGVFLNFEANQNGRWVNLSSLRLDLLHHPEQRKWRPLSLLLTADTSQIRISTLAHQPSAEDAGRYTVWISVAGAHRGDIDHSIQILGMVSDFIASTLFSGLGLIVLFDIAARMKKGGWFLLSEGSPPYCCANLSGLLIAAMALSPTAAWIFIDRSPFGGDQSQYGKATIDLFIAQGESFGTWVNSMATVLRYKPPGITWIGQAFVSLGALLGSLNISLLLSVLLVLFMALALIYWSIFAISGGSFLISSAGLLLTASAPAFAYLSHQYFVEPLQLLTISWFVFILCKAPQWSTVFTLAHLAAAASLAMLAKASSPLYCAVPGALSVGTAFYWGNARSRWVWKNVPTILTAIIGTLLLVATVIWYAENFSYVRQHISAASAGPIAAVWGKQDTFIKSLTYWLKATWDSFDGNAATLFPSTFLVWSVIILLGVVAFLGKRKRSHRYATTCALVALIQIAMVWTVFSLNANRETRYLLALLPYFAVMMGWALVQIHNQFVNIFVVAVLAGQLAIGSIHELKVTDRDGSNEAILEEIVQVTCGYSFEKPSDSIIAIDPTLKPDWLAAVPASYVAARERAILQGKSSVCRYSYLGDSFFGNTADNSWSSIVAHPPDFVVTIDPEIYPPTEQSLNQALRPKNFQMFFHRLKESGLFSLIGRLESDPGILVFSEPLRAGRILSDQGKHIEAIASLEKSTQRDPDNPEVWANLQLALLRKGEITQSILAGRKALALTPNHHYVLMQLGDAQERLGQAEQAIEWFERAARHAPKPEALRTSLESLARVNIALNRTQAACRYLQQAQSVAAGRNLIPELQQHGCN